MEVRNNLQTVKVRMMCECGGEMEPTGEIYDTYPPRYPHKCLKCGEGEIYSRRYPCIEYSEE